MIHSLSVINPSHVAADCVQISNRMLSSLIKHIMLIVIFTFTCRWVLIHLDHHKKGILTVHTTQNSEAFALDLSVKIGVKCLDGH